MHATPVPFPRNRPEGYAPLDDEPEFDPARHLALEAPRRTWSLAEFGYGDHVIAATPSPVAAAGPFRLLSEKGVATVRHVCRALRHGVVRMLGQARTGAYVSGATYRSRFLRGLCNSVDVAAFLSDVAGTRLIPHSMPSLQVYVNFAPDDIEQAVDNWHVDSIGFDYVLMASDPAHLAGGYLQFFRGTLEDAANLLGTTPDLLTEGFVDELPGDLVETVDFPAAGHGFFQQGNLVLHRATRLEKPGERITLVSGYVAADTAVEDPTKVERIIGWDEPAQLAELARHAAWRSSARLQHLVDELPMADDAGAIVHALRKATRDIDRLVSALQARLPDTATSSVTTSPTRTATRASRTTP